MFSLKSAIVEVALATAFSTSAAVFAQPTLAAPVSTQALEFPVLMRQQVEAGKMPVGMKVQAKLTVATLVTGIVVPEGAVLSGEVIESVAKSATHPSRLAIRMDSVRWKNGSASAVLSLAHKVYLTAWYYAAAPQTMEDRPDLSDVHARDWNNDPRPEAPYPGYYPGYVPDADRPRVSAPSASDIPKHYSLMKDVESKRRSDGTVILTSRRSNVKLDKSTTYVLAAGELLPPK